MQNTAESTMPTKAQTDAAELKKVQDAIDLKKAARKTEVRRARATKEISDEIAPYAIKEEEDTTITKVITIMTMSTKLSVDDDYVDSLDSVYDNIAITRVRELIKGLDVTDSLTKKEFDAACVQMLAILFVDQNTEVLMRTARTEIPKRAHGETIVGYHKRFMTASRANKFVMELNGHSTAKSEKAEEAMLYLKKINCSWAQSQFLRDAADGTNDPDQLMRMVQRHITLVDGIGIDDGLGVKQPVKELAVNHIHEERQSQVGNKRDRDDTNGNDVLEEKLANVMAELANVRDQQSDEQDARRNQECGHCKINRPRVAHTHATHECNASQGGHGNPAKRQRRDQWCDHCRRSGHSIEDCRSKNNGSRGNSHNNGNRTNGNRNNGNHNNGNRQSGYNAGRSGNSKQQSPITCYKCGKEGHMQNECRGQVKCHQCGNSGHMAKDCQSQPKPAEQTTNNALNATAEIMRNLGEKIEVLGTRVNKLTDASKNEVGGVDTRMVTASTALTVPKTE
jgi:hypothetical protein